MSARQYAALPDPFPMHRGGVLRGARVAFETWGSLAPARDNAILVFTGLSPSAHAARSAADSAPTRQSSSPSRRRIASASAGRRMRPIQFGSCTKGSIWGSTSSIRPTCIRRVGRRSSWGRRSQGSAIAWCSGCGRTRRIAWRTARPGRPASGPDRMGAARCRRPRTAQPERITEHRGRRRTRRHPCSHRPLRGAARRPGGRTRADRAAGAGVTGPRNRGSTAAGIAARADGVFSPLGGKGRAAFHEAKA